MSKEAHDACVGRKERNCKWSCHYLWLSDLRVSCNRTVKSCESVQHISPRCQQHIPNGKRQHFSVLSAMGITIGYTSVISQGKEPKKTTELDIDGLSANDNADRESTDDELDGELQERRGMGFELGSKGTDDIGGGREGGVGRQEAKKKHKCKQTPGMLFELLNACQTTACEVSVC